MYTSWLIVAIFVVWNYIDSEYKKSTWIFWKNIWKLWLYYDPIKWTISRKKPKNLSRKKLFRETLLCLLSRISVINCIIITFKENKKINNMPERVKSLRWNLFNKDMTKEEVIKTIESLSEIDNEPLVEELMDRLCLDF